jgi:2-polyprenyl-3-methyl-5-hydroxy-6-metoxy-1,4-benzoquinol methylase
MATETELRHKALSQVKSFLAECDIKDYQGKKIFEIGFKNGLFLDQCRKEGLIPTGLEISKEYVEQVKSKLPHLDLLWYDGGTFPVPDASYDFVVSYQVLEHINSTEHIINESIRILKPGGIMYHVSPNYCSFYEGHYNLIWLPFLNKTLGRYYLKMLRRYTPYYESLNIIKPRVVKRVLRRCGSDITVLSLGQREFTNNFNAEQIEKVNQKLLKKALGLLLRLGFIKDYFLWLVTWANLYYPIIIIAKKK